MNAYMVALVLVVVAVVTTLWTLALRRAVFPRDSHPTNDATRRALDAAHAENARLREEVAHLHAELRESRRANVQLVTEARRLIQKHSRPDEITYEDPPSVGEADRQAVVAEREMRRRELEALAVLDEDVPPGVAIEVAEDEGDEEGS